MSEPSRVAAPSVWVLTDDRPGNRTQAIGIAHALELPFEEKRLAFNRKAGRAAPRLGATLATLAEVSRALIAPPFPRLVIAAGRRTTPVARWIKQASGGEAKIVLIGRRPPVAGADLTVRAGYLGQRSHPKLMELALPLTRVDAETLRAVRSAAPDPLAGLARPRVLVLVGGPTGQHEMGVELAGRLGAEVERAADAIGGSLAALTSRRTPRDCVSALRAAAPGAMLREWSADDPPDLYLSFLANADLMVVTGESESMLAEAIASGLPVTIYPLPTRRPSFKVRLRWTILRMSQQTGPLAALCRRLMDEGWVAPRRDMDAMHQLMVERSFARLFDGSLNRQAPRAHDERPAIKSRLSGLIGEEAPYASTEDAAHHSKNARDS